MTLTTRRLLYTFFILVFITITPIIILYASGYKLSNGFNIQKTGALIFDTRPQGAKIYLNDKPYNNFFDSMFAIGENYLVTPAKIKNLLPGEYQIRLEMDGYWPWEKKLTVFPGQSTYVEDVTLFQKNLPILSSAYNGSEMSISPDGKYMLLLGGDNISLYNANNDQTSLIASSSKVLLAKARSAWSPDSSKVLADKIIINVSDLSILNIEPSVGLNAANIKWSENSNLIYYLNDAELFHRDLNNKTDEKIIPGQNIHDYLIKNDIIYFVPTSNLPSKLVTWGINNKKIVNQVNLPNSQYEFTNAANFYINLFDRQSNILYLIDPNNPLKPLKEIFSNVSAATWIDNNKMIYHNEFEIWLYENDSSAKKILTRISEPIKSIFWHPSNNYILYATKSSVNILELDDREKYNITKLIGLDNIISPAMSLQGDKLFFLSEIGKQKGLFSLQIE